MTRARTSNVTKRKHQKILKFCKGYKGRSKNCYRVALQRLEKAWQYSYRDRRTKKRDFRKLWIQRLNAAVRQHGMIYSKFIHALKTNDIQIDRKILSNLAIYNPEAFTNLVKKITSK